MTDETRQLLTAAITDRGLSEKRPQNEDSYLSLPEHGIFAVADGVGGAMAGDVASQMAVEILGEAFSNYSGTVAPEEIMTVAIDRANLAINQMASELPQLSSMATTIVALHLSGDSATIAHVGDSRLYRLDREGNLYRETSDHSVVEEEVRAGRMTREQAATHPSRNIISRAVGAELSVDIDLKTINVEPGTTFLLCSDGVTRHIEDQELANLLTTGMSVEMLCEQLKEMCYNRGAEDNLTAVIVKVPASAKIAEEAPQSYREDLSTVPDEVIHEEETIATARSPFYDHAETPTIETRIEQPPSLDSIGSEHELAKAIEQPPVYEVGSEEPSDSNDEPYLMESEPEERTESIIPPVEEEPEVSSEYTSSRVIVPATTAATSAAPDREFSMFGETPQPKVIHQERSSITGGSILRSLIYLLLGAALGAAGVYFFMQPEPQPETQVIPVQDLSPKSSNVPASTLEELRWNVDRDPEAYVQASVASAKDAADHYILGRALFLSGKHFEAKRQFALALDKLPGADPKSAATIRVEIAMMSAIIGDGQADEAFKRSFGEARKQNIDSIDPANTNISPSNNSSNTNLVP